MKVIRTLSIVRNLLNILSLDGGASAGYIDSVYYNKFIFQISLRWMIGLKLRHGILISELIGAHIGEL